MLQLTQVLRAPVGSNAERDSTATVELRLAFEDRRRSRLLVRLSDGSEAALVLPRGTVLRDGDCVSSDGAASSSVVVTIRAAAEELSVARTSDPNLLARAAYHLGNRHIPLQIHPGELSYQHDHVLDGMVRELGLVVTTESAPFEPEAGGYRHAGTTGGSHSHGHSHEHDASDDHVHPHGHSHPHPHAHAHPERHSHDHLILTTPK